MIVTKRAYEPAAAADGFRVLIDRLWPRGVPKAKARLDAWEKDIARSRELREWYGHDPAKWPDFRRRYMRELRTPAAIAVLDTLVRRVKRGRVTLVYASKATDISDVVVLEQLLKRRSRLPQRRHGPVPDVSVAGRLDPSHTVLVARAASQQIAGDDPAHGHRL
jgi:uncharacterized protein YeaO (DUF488 family)